MRNTFAQTMLAVGQEDTNLVVMVGDIGHFALQPFAKACPGRYYNIGILEPTIVGIAAGLSAAGLYPVAHTIAPFLIERSLEQIKLDFCYQELGGNLISVGSAFDYAGLGCSHHCYNDIGLIAGLPNTEVIYPASPVEFRKLFRETYKNKKLTYFRIPGDTHNVEFQEGQIQLGKGIQIQAGSDITIATCGPSLKHVMNAIQLLQKDKISADVLYFPTIKPFDQTLLQTSAKKTGTILVIEEHSAVGGLGHHVSLASRHMTGLVWDSINIPNEFSRGYGSYQDHLDHVGITPENIHRVAMKLIQQSKGAK